MAADGSILQLLQGLTPHRTLIGILCLAIPVATFGVGWLLARVSPPACARFLTVPLHLTVLPGVGLSLIVAYLLFFARDNLVAGHDAVIFFGPILCMALTLVAVRRLMPFERVPGFDRLGGLMLLAAVAFGITYVLYQMAFRVWFFASFEVLLIIFAVSFALLRLGVRRVFGAGSR